MYTKATGEKLDRNLAIYQRVKNGDKIKAISRDVGLTPEAVRRIVSDLRRIEWHSGSLDEYINEVRNGYVRSRDYGAVDAAGFDAEAYASIVRLVESAGWFVASCKNGRHSSLGDRQVTLVIRPQTSTT